MADQLILSNHPPVAQSGRWVSEYVYAEFSGLALGTLANWRYLDREAGRNASLPGRPVYRYFGGAVRYWMDSSDVRGGIGKDHV